MSSKWVLINFIIIGFSFKIKFGIIALRPLDSVA